MDSVSYHVYSRRGLGLENAKQGNGGELIFYIELEGLPDIDDFTDETKGRIALEILKSMKTQHILNFAVYTEEGGSCERDRTIDIV